MSPRVVTLEYIESLRNAQKYLYRFAGPAFALLGLVNGILSLAVFTQKSLRKNPCSTFFIVYNIAILCLICTSFIPLTLEIGYEITPAAHHPGLCRLRLYTTFLFNCLCPFYLLLASVDRAIVTSPNARTRRRSTLRCAYKSILIGTLLWMAGLIHVLIYAHIIRLSSNQFICYLRPGGYGTFVSYMSLTKEIFIPFAMGIFGLWSIRNVRYARRIMTGSTSVSTVAGTQAGASAVSVHSKDRQLILMLLVDIIIYIFFSFIVAISLMHEQVTMYDRKSVEELLLQGLIKSVAMFTAHIPFCVNSYANLIVSKTFRKEVKKLLSWKRLVYRCQRR